MSNQPSAKGGASPSNATGWYVVSILVLAYICSYIDRTILTLLVKPIRASLQITDVQFSLLHGLAFVIFYVSLGIPIARLADSGNRKRLITAGVTIWSAMTALCGTARSFTQLFLWRVGVGVGESTLSPAAYSMISDYFKGSALARALSVYTSSIYIGAGLAMILGGAVIASVGAMDLPILGHFEPWQVVFLIVGLLGLPVALLMLTIREPKRTGLAKISSAADLSFKATLGFINDRRGAYFLMFVGYALFSLVWNGSSAWIPSFLIRSFGWTSADVGYSFGLIMLIFGAIGVISGGLVSSWLQARGHTDANVMVGILASLLLFPAGIAAPLLATPAQCMTVYGLFVFAGSLPFGCAAAAFQDLTPNQMRAQVTAIYFLLLNLAGIGLGPTVVALISEQGFGSDLAIGKALAIVAAVFAPLAAICLALARAPYRRHVIVAS
jgi:MFS family permease